MQAEKEGKNTSKIQEIPEGETMFLFCVIKGKTRALTAFMDNGCSSWLVKDGVPEKELMSIKLRDGPIPMGVASGHTVFATAEWASLLPLADSSHQIVRGLSFIMVTGNFGDLHLDPITEELKEAGRNAEGPGVDEVKRLRAPKEISREVDMLI